MTGWSRSDGWVPVHQIWRNFVRDVHQLWKTVSKRRVTTFARPGKQQYAWQSSASPNNSLPTPTTFFEKKSAEVEFYIRATKPVRSKWGRCQSGVRWQGTENAARLPRCPRLRLLRVRHKLSGTSRASSPPRHSHAAAPQLVCQTRDTISSSPGARVCLGPSSFLW